MNIGDQLPDLSLPNADGVPVRLRDNLPCVLYFYPKADTPGCTTEAKDFTARADDFERAGVSVFAVSRDTVQKLARFRDKHDLGITLLSDADGAVSDAFGTWIEKSLYGRKYMGLERATFHFDAAGRCVAQWRGVKVKGHADAVCAAVG